MIVDAMSSSVPQEGANHVVEGMYANTWTKVMPNRLATCGSMQKGAGVTKRWQRQMRHGIWMLQGRYWLIPN